VNLLKTGSAYYAPFGGGCRDGGSHLERQEENSALRGVTSTGIRYQGLVRWRAVKLGAKGAEEIIQIKLTAEENAALQKSAASVKEL